MPPRQQAPAKTGRRIPYFPNTHVHGISKHKAVEYINNVLSPKIARYIILEEPDKNTKITKENSWKFPQGGKGSRIARALTPLMQSGSSLGNRLGFFDSDTANFVGIKDTLHSKSEINVSWEHARLRVKYGEVPWFDSELPRDVFCDLGTNHEDLHHLMLLKRYPNAVIRERGLTYFKIEPGKLRDYLSPDKTAKITKVYFEAAESPDAVVDLMADDGVTILETITAEYKWLAYLLPKNGRPIDDAFQCFDCYEYSFVDRKVWDEPPVYYYLQKQWQMYGEGAKRCHFQCMSPWREARYWDVHYDEEIMAMCVSLVNHIFETFILKGLSVPTNYFTRDAPTNVKKTHRDMLIAIKGNIITEMHHDIPKEEVQRTLLAVQRWLKPDQDIKELEYWYGLQYPRFPKCMPLYAVVFTHRVALLGESQDVMVTNIVKSCHDTGRRWQNLRALSAADPFKWLSRVLDAASANIDIEMHELMHGKDRVNRDDEIIKKQFEMKWLHEAERIFERACSYCYYCLHPTEYDANLKATHINQSTITPSIIHSVTRAISETLTKCITNKSLPQIGNYTPEQTEQVIRRQAEFALEDPRQTSGNTSNYSERLERLIRSCLTLINYASRQKEQEDEDEEHARIKPLAFVALEGILIKDGTSTTCADKSMFGLFKNVVACASVLDTFGLVDHQTWSTRSIKK
jgi:hypothetical protein